jgi:hypothetical protein
MHESGKNSLEPGTKGNPVKTIFWPAVKVKGLGYKAQNFQVTSIINNTEVKRHVSIPYALHPAPYTL